MHHLSPIQHSLAHRGLDIDISVNICPLSVQAKVSADAKPSWNSHKFNTTIEANITLASKVQPEWKGGEYVDCDFTRH